MTSSPGRFALVSEGPQFDPMSFATRAPVHGPRVRLTLPGDSGSGQFRGRPAFKGDLGPCLMSRRVDLLSRATWALVGETAVLNRRPGDSGPCPKALDVDQLSRATQDRARGPGFRTAVPGDSCFCPRAPGFKWRSLGTRAQFQRPAGSTTCTGRLGQVIEGPWCRPTLPGDSGSGPRSRGLPAVPGDSGPCLMSCWFDQLSQGT